MSELVYDVIDQIVVLKTTVIATFFGVLIFTAVSLFATRNFAWSAKNVKLMGFFYSITKKHSKMLAMIWIKLFIIIAIVFDDIQIYGIQIAIYLFSVIFYLIYRHNLVETGVIIFNNATIMFLLYVMSFLHSYLVNISYNTIIAFVMVLLKIFLIAFSCFEIVWSALHITTDFETENTVYKKIDERTIERHRRQVAKAIENKKKLENLKALQTKHELETQTLAEIQKRMQRQLDANK